MRRQPSAPMVLWIAALITLALGQPTLARAEPGPAEIEGVSFPGAVRVGDTPLKLHSVGVLRWYFLKGYVAGLYLGSETPPEDVLENRPKRLELHYFYAISRSDFGEAAWKVMSRMLDEPALEKIRARAERLAGAYQDVEPGDRYALTYLPGVGTQLTLNGEPKITIPGADFASAYFGIWLGSDPIDAPLRDQLLAQEWAEAQ
ncbi:MAG: chalcone isomerase family protein [Myxococcota bacterium]